MRKVHLYVPYAGILSRSLCGARGISMPVDVHYKTSKFREVTCIRCLQSRADTLTRETAFTAEKASRCHKQLRHVRSVRSKSNGGR